MASKAWRSISKATEEELAAFVEEMRSRPPAAAQIAEIEVEPAPWRRAQRIHDTRKRTAGPANRPRLA